MKSILLAALAFSLQAFALEVKVVEAESGALKSPMTKMGTFIRTNQNYRGEAQYRIEVAAEAVYRFDFKVRAAKASSDSVRLVVNGSTHQLKFEGGKDPDRFVIKRSSASYRDIKLRKGTHTVLLRGGEANTDIDLFRVYLKSDAAAVAAADASALPPSPPPPADPGPSEPPPANPGKNPITSGDYEALLDGLFGFAAGTTGGKGGAICRVTTLAASGAGSLAACARGSSPKWIVFDVSGTIKLSSPIQVGSNTTIDGRGANILITGRGLNVINVSNVVIHNLEVRDVDGDGFTVYAANRVWIDHVKVSETRDGAIDITEGSMNVTVSWSLLTGQNKTMLIGANNANTLDRQISVTLHHNYFVGTERRNPLVRYGRVHLFNNLISNWGTGGGGGDAIATTYEAQLAVENNVFEAGANKRAVRIIVENWIEVEGYIRTTGNLALNGAVVFSHHPERVFQPSSAYAYPLEAADTSLMQRIAAGAGPK
jgi:pectate lyase